MKDVVYVKELLRSEYATERDHEIPYPPLDAVVREQEFSFKDGVVEGEEPFGSENRDGKQYLHFKSGNKSIYTHRFIVSYALGRWMPRECVVDHINHDPTDNRPSNLRIVTPRDNAQNRREALLSELVDLDGVKEKERKPVPVKAIPPEPEPEPIEVVTPHREPEKAPTETRIHSFDTSKVPMSTGPISGVRYTGETMPAKYAGPYGGAWYKTNLDSWHLLFEPPAELKD
ncbi:HNH endonuclease [Ruegeria halocynthiae]|uniref:HNH endonuclease n=1 Tax=Ruegeria halocynthiae TaxID=985054 RepID=A0A1H2RDS2_9RHOB|nr:HNH endonuclease signature motif containing protein [Ruegeria halocynthiae]SDW17616.1 HNH endonuclease [Ruegeria halocynthiae]